MMSSSTTASSSQVSSDEVP
uniref:Uncharacterized protein n=1 Tax=Anguilla anguilla TaxID=7936 RepID=A0A0E9XZG3_ANGAN